MPDTAKAPPKHFVVIVPGILGSRLRRTDTQELVWGDFRQMLSNPLQVRQRFQRMMESLVYPNPLEPDGILDEVVVFPPLIEIGQYDRLVNYLHGQLGYSLTDGDPAVYAFGYDWRQDNRLSAEKLGEAIDGWRAKHPGAEVWLLAHSNGGLVSRWYIEMLGGKQWVTRFFALASPRGGAPQALATALSGPKGVLRPAFALLGIDTRPVVKTWPCLYQLLPHDAGFVTDSENHAVNLFEDTDWLSEAEHRRLLQDARQFHADLIAQESSPTASHVETVCVYGTKNKTTTTGRLLATAGGWDVEWLTSEAGDGTVPVSSALHPTPVQFPVVAAHIDVYIHPQTALLLEHELVTKYTAPERAFLETPLHAVQFEPTEKTYRPGETVQVWATVTRRDDDTAVTDAVIAVTMEWRDPLPASPVSGPSGPLPTMTLALNAASGRYEGALPAPAAEGYYTLVAHVTIPGPTPLDTEAVDLAELVVIDSMSLE